MDNRTPEQRRRNMQNIKQKNTKLELIFIKALREKGIWFTTHRTDVFGKPDIVFKRKKIAVFIDSDFWHGKKTYPEDKSKILDSEIRSQPKQVYRSKCKTYRTRMDSIKIYRRRDKKRVIKLFA